MLLYILNNSDKSQHCQGLETGHAYLLRYKEKDMIHAAEFSLKLYGVNE